MADTPASADEADENPAEAEAPSPYRERYGCPSDAGLGQVRVFVPADRWREVAEAAFADGYLQCLDLCVVDYLGHPGRSLPPEVAPGRFEVVANLIDHARCARRAEDGRIRLRAQVSEDDASIESLFRVWPGTENLEREAFDLFGVDFVGHPGLVRILLHDEWSGHPLRKDYEVGSIPVQFKAGSTAR